MKLVKIGAYTHVDPLGVDVIRWSEKRGCPVLIMNSGEKVFAVEWGMGIGVDHEVKVAAVHDLIEFMEVADKPEPEPEGQWWWPGFGQALVFVPTGGR